MHKLVASKIVHSKEAELVTKQANNVTDELTGAINMLLDAFNKSQKEVVSLKKELSSLSVMLGELSASNKKNNLSNHKKVAGKNYSFGITDATRVNNNTLFRTDTGSLIWVDELGVQTTIVA